MELYRTANKREQLLSGAAMVLILIIFFRLVYIPSNQNQVNLNTQIINLRMEKDALEKFVKALQQKLPSLKGREIKGPMTAKTKILMGEEEPMTENVAELFKLLSAHSFLKGVRIQELSHIPLKSANGYTEQSFFIGLEGTFRNVAAYLSRVEALPALLSVDNLSIKVVTPKASEIRLELNGSLFALGGGTQ